ncbi:hypothetical protein ACFP81_12340 [Deinococcus lacus]|uniref:Uncharacterized protein n=1 Tax=Deinococcus lacus TaxID=392561 RepID=A0ABW1YEH3_9DEIO
MLATLALGSVAGAQTQDYCSVVAQGNGSNLGLEGRPTIVGYLATTQTETATFNIPLDGGPDGTLNDSVNYGGTVIPYGSQELYYYGNGFEYKGDLTAGNYTQNGQTGRYSDGSYTWGNVEAGKAQIVYLRVQARSAGNLTGRGATMSLTYQGTVYADFVTRPVGSTYAPTITARNGASLRGRNGEAVPTLVTTLTNSGPFWEYFVVLPPNLAGTGDVKLTFRDSGPPDSRLGGLNYTDDIFFTTPAFMGAASACVSRIGLPTRPTPSAGPTWTI